MRVLHFSDIHVGVPLRRMPLSDWLGKRAIGAANLLTGRYHHFVSARGKLKALDRFKREQAIDLVLFTGDYTALGLDRELAEARAVVEPLMDAPLGFVNVPGNHDLYVPDVIRHRRFERHFGDTLESDLPELCAEGPWPLVRLAGDGVAVVAVNSARPNPQPWRSSGVIPAEQLSALGNALRDPRVRGRFVFVITHYAPRLADGGPDRKLHGMINADDFLKVCSEIPRGVILCGHIHRRYTVKIDGVAPAIFCAGSATMARRESVWVFDVDEGKARATPGRWNGTGYELLPDSAVDA